MKEAIERIYGDVRAAKEKTAENLGITLNQDVKTLEDWEEQLGQDLQRKAQEDLDSALYFPLDEVEDARKTMEDWIKGQGDWSQSHLNEMIEDTKQVMAEIPKVVINQGGTIVKMTPQITPVIHNYVSANLEGLSQGLGQALSGMGAIFLQGLNALFGKIVEVLWPTEEKWVELFLTVMKTMRKASLLALEQEKMGELMKERGVG